MRLLIHVAAGALLLAVCAAADKPAAKARVSLELVTEKDIPITGTQQWYRVFADLGVGSLRIRPAVGKEETGIEQRGNKAAPVYDVVGIIKADNTLYLPGGKFTVNDGARLKKWLADLADQGVEGVAQPRQAFGLTRSQLTDVDGELKRPLPFATKDVPAAKAVEQLAQGLQHKLQIDADAAKSLADSTVEEDLQGVSAGTALAVILRPAGLVFSPQRPSGGTLQYQVSKPQAGHESWPIGWKADQPDSKVLPDMFTKFINVEIDQTPVTDAVAALQDRLKVPVLWDHNALALHGIDPAKIEVKLPAKKLTYSLILQRVLSQAKLKKEIRVDESGKPFIWITTIKPS
jgi:hypothetical protein